MQDKKSPYPQREGVWYGYAKIGAIALSKIATVSTPQDTGITQKSYLSATYP